MDAGSGMVLVVLAFVIFLLTGIVVFLLMRRTPPANDGLTAGLESLKADLLAGQLEGLVSLRTSLDSAGSMIGQRLDQNNKTLDSRLAMFGEIENKLGSLQHQANNMERIGNNIQSLTELLKPPQIRGRVGEMLLENLIAEILPRSLYETQFQFSDGGRVDVVVKLADRYLPIDSKFPLESFQRLIDSDNDPKMEKEFIRVVKKHVDDISRRYVRPGENTTDVAIMYIPSEAVYMSFVSRISDGFEYALDHKVVPSSPGHLYAFLASLAMMFRQAGLGADSRRLAAGLQELTDSVDRLNRFHERMEGSLRSFSSALEKARLETNSMNGRLLKLNEPVESAEISS